MKDKIHKAATLLNEQTQNTEYFDKVYIKGGCLRDLLLGKTEINDIDVVVNVPDSYITLSKLICNNLKCRGLYNPFIEKHNGTSIFMLFHENGLNDIYFDIKDLDESLETDCHKRVDFTCNGLYLNVNTLTLIDVTELGIEDIHNKVIRMVHKDVFKISPIRIVRLIRLVADFGFTVEAETLQQFYNDCHLIKKITDKDFIKRELNKIKNVCDDEGLQQTLETIKEYVYNEEVV